MAIFEGKPAPAFTLADAQGEKVSLRDFLGRQVIVYFYPRDHTPGCTKEACGFRDLGREIGAAGAVVIGISQDDPATHADFAAKFRLPFVLLSDPDRKVMRRYGAWGEKVLYGKKREGVIRSTVWIDAAGRVRKHWKRVPDAALHPTRVLDALRAGG